MYIMKCTIMMKKINYDLLIMYKLPVDPIYVAELQMFVIADVALSVV